MAVVARILPYLHSKSYETRSAASNALSQIFSLVPVWQPQDTDVKPSVEPNPHAPEFPSFSVQELMQKGSLLLASSGKEFSKPAGILSSSSEVKRARKEAMGRLGLDFLDSVGGADDMDLDKELAVETELDAEDDPENAMKVEETPVSSSPMDVDFKPKQERSSPARPDSTTPTGPSLPTTSGASAGEDASGLSARERNRLKRKRKPGNSAFVAAPPPPPPSAGSKYNPTPAGPSNKARLVSSEDGDQHMSRVDSPHPATNGVSVEKVVVDPSKGGAVSPKAAQQSKALEVIPGAWIWDGIVRLLEVDLFSETWEVRHGAAMALRELLKVQGKNDCISWEDNASDHERWCNDLAAKLLCVFVLDRFGDFVSDQVIAPVRETVSQTLASLLLHMPRRSVIHVHSILIQMIRQDFLLTSSHAHVWEVRHAGLLGIKYEVAVRTDLFEAMKKDEGCDYTGKEVLQGVVDAAVLGLGDHDDDVRAVAASCLLPVAGHLVNELPESLDRVLTVLWSCLRDMKDDLSSSVGAVMDLLGKLVAYDKVIDILAQTSVSLPLSTLAPTLFPFFRHTIPNVRLAVVNTLHSFMMVSSLPRDWIVSPFLRLLFQNLIVEERSDIRQATLSAWRTALDVLSSVPGWTENVITQQVILEWYAIMMTPLGVTMDSSTFYSPSVTADGHGLVPERHNVDKNMLSQDLALVAVEVILQARIAAATALSYLIASWSIGAVEELFQPILVHYLESTSMLQKFLAAIVSEEWAHACEAKSPSSSLIEKFPLAQELSKRTLFWLQAPPPAAYHEMAFALHRIHAECYALLHCFASDCKLPISTIPYLGAEIDITGTKADCFTIDTAHAAVGSMYTKLKENLGRTKKRELVIINEKRQKVVMSIDRYVEVKAQHDIRVSAAFAAAFVAFKSTPDKNEENLDLQTRSAVAVALFIDFCVQHNIAQPPDKIVKNLCTFLCQDVDQTPTFAYTRSVLDGILSFQTSYKPAGSRNGRDGHDRSDTPKADEASSARLSRRGAGLAFNQLSTRFGSRLFQVLPKMWQSMAGGLLSACGSGSPQEADNLMEKQFGQDVIDSLSVLEAVVPTLHPDLWPKLSELFPVMASALQSRYAIIRQSAARCFAAVCDVMTSEAMRFVIENIIPVLGDPVVLSNRQGAAEVIYHVVQKLDIKALPYVIFLVVPVLGRMSDSDDDIRSTATNTFASLVKMVPLEAGLPDPPGFTEDLLKRRETERQFLTQLLDGTKVELYSIPVTINAELRKYQQDGVNWLAFLGKYQLHGILCDDMGLGKTLQSICILASKHFERSEKHKETKSPDAVHLPSLIVCPPTLTGHWYYEILKYADNLRPILYTGNSRERSRILSKLAKHDVVITSYEVVRNDIASLEGLNWLYCILDEGHVIKNAKTKLTKAVKCIRAQHRLILSGTPIQNNVLELWSLFDFLMPGFLGTESSFNERFGKPILSNRDGKAKSGEAAALALEALHKQVLPFLLRRLKEDVLHDLPPKIIQDYYCELSEIQKTLYDDFAKSQARVNAEDVIQKGAAQTKEGGQQHVFQSLQYLRKLCNHPALVLKNDTEAINAAFAKVGSKHEGLNDIQHAPKLLALRQLLTDCGIGCNSGGEGGKSDAADGVSDSTGAFSQHRVLIFCQMKQMLDIIETDLFKPHMPSVTYMRLDGGTDATKRHAVVQTFNSDPSIDCLLLTTHVGGLGLTLTGADTVIFVEHDWNPMKDLQAMDRAHRIGQKKVVNVYRLITKGTLEEKIMGLQRFKLNIANSVVTQQNAGLSSMDTDLVLDLFKRTNEEEDAAARKKAKEAHGPLSQKNVLQGLDELPEEEEYEGLDLSSFMVTDTHGQPLTALCFDPVSDTLWTGSNTGHVVALHTVQGARGVSFPVGGGLAVKKISVGDNYVRALSIAGEGVGSWAKGGMNKWFFRDLTTITAFSDAAYSSNIMAVASAAPELLLLNSMTGKAARQTSTPSVITHLQFSHSSLLSASSDGFVRAYDARTGLRREEGENSVQAHTSGIQDFQVSGNFFYTIGWMVTSGQGLVNVVDVSNPNNVSGFYQLDTVSYITSTAVSSNGSFIAFGDSGGTVHLMTATEGDSDSLLFNGFEGQEIEWADPAEEIPQIEWTVSTPLNTIGLPHYNSQLLSSWTPQFVSSSPNYPPPAKIPQQILNTMKTNDNVAYAALPKELKGRRNRAVVTPARDQGRFRSGNKGRNGPELEATTLDDSVEEVPRIYRKVEIEYSKFGVEDFDFGFYNHTAYSGLETHILNSYTNALVQVMSYSHAIRQLAKSHITTNCPREHCLLCELGFVVRMLEDAGGTNCQSSNFCKTVGVLAQAQNQLELIDYGREHTEVDYTHTIQAFHRFLIDHLSLEGNVFPHNPVIVKHPSFQPDVYSPAAAPVTQLLGIDAKNIITCMSCKAVRGKENMTHIIDMVYPRKITSSDPPYAADFTSVLRSSLIRQMSHKATCQTCKQFATFSSRRSIPTRDLPPILAVNASVYNEENLKFWLDNRNQTFLKPQIEMQGQVEGVDDPDVVIYELRALVVQIVPKTKHSHLVSIVKVPGAEGQKGPWFVFNDFVVRNITEDEAFSFPSTWKVPAILYLERVDLQERLDLSGLPDEIDQSILSRDTSISINRDKNLVKHECLRFEELPKPGTLVAIDAEFVSMQQEETEFRSDGTNKVLRPARLSLARVSVLRGDGPKQGVPFIDDHIHTSEVIVDYLTEFSGIKFGDLDPHLSRHTLTPLKLVYKKLRLLVDRGCIFIGHGLSKDFRIINIHVPPDQVIDTVDLYFLKARQRRLSLRFLSWFVLHENIQTDTHDSIEDARSALRLYKAYHEFEEQGIFDMKLEELYREGRQYNWKPPLPTTTSALPQPSLPAISTSPALQQYPMMPPRNFAQANFLSNNLKFIGIPDYFPTSDSYGNNWDQRGQR
ncbi:hypothetical protein SERLA73DRAFT_170610 [Serpula lacrymans var. lacrymans S7.3]|uniref:TATA-binding protein-associated factor mot1 n=2 Tax=Serpula lacrymans var. lacrymans TaxID=341189 RepID=F8Q6G0_SERL3|nr:uncharacterized protein SERLADRAFT_451754 [Serpula lacrymans var. lacrymans S7.9]EGN96198.1 hypothetical protein SERLA73DRAFT_170610 [Serpula lacrymans var. lacrymans S7.3]EGO21736.1 hypothetical protein SERLADRAFT_451754 [Serpula lacrymans var. lacrymans S7.9]